MRISKPGSPASPPPLDSLLPMEKSWALEVEREDRMQCEGELIQSDTGVGQRDGNCCWTSSKRLNIGKEVYARPGMVEDERTNRWVSKISNPRVCKYDGHAMRRCDESHGEMENADWRSRDQGFTSVSRCYPPNVQDRGTHLSHTSETRQECSSKGKRASGFEVNCNRSARKELECKPEDTSFSSQDGYSDHGRPSGKFSIRQNRTKQNYGGKVRNMGHQDSKEILSQCKSAGSKRYNDAAAYNDFIEKKQYDNPAAYDDVITSCYDDAAAYTAVDSSASKEVTCSNITVLQVQASMDIDDDDAEAAEIVSMAPGVVSPAKNTDIDNRMQRSKVASEKSSRRNTQCATAPMLSPAVFVDVTNRFELHAHPGAKDEAQETDAHRLCQRQRQIEYGKNTLGYERYTELMPKLKRKARDPQTPNPKQICSKRSWDGQIRKWRRLLHVYDPPSEDGEEIAEDLSVVKLPRGCIEEANSDAADGSPRPQRICNSTANRGSNPVEENIGMESNPVEENIGMEDGSLSIYDDWMEP